MDEKKLWEILIPRADNAGVAFTDAHRDAWLDAVAADAGGLTVCGDVTGYWRTPTGRMLIEHMTPVRLYAPRATVARAVAQAGEHFAQTAVMAYVLSTEVVGC